MQEPSTFTRGEWGARRKTEPKEPPFLLSKELELEWSSQSGCLQYSTTQK